MPVTAAENGAWEKLTKGTSQLIKISTEYHRMSKRLCHHKRNRNLCSILNCTKRNRNLKAKTWVNFRQTVCYGIVAYETICAWFKVTLPFAIHEYAVCWYLYTCPLISPLSTNADDSKCIVRERRWVLCKWYGFIYFKTCYFPEVERMPWMIY